MVSRIPFEVRQFFISFLENGGQSRGNTSWKTCFPKFYGTLRPLAWFPWALQYNLRIPLSKILDPLLCVIPTRYSFDNAIGPREPPRSDLSEHLCFTARRRTFSITAWNKVCEKWIRRRSVSLKYSSVTSTPLCIGSAKVYIIPLRYTTTSTSKFSYVREFTFTSIRPAGVAQRRSVGLGIERSRVRNSLCAIWFLFLRQGN